MRFKEIIGGLFDEPDKKTKKKKTVNPKVVMARKVYDVATLYGKKIVKSDSSWSSSRC